MRLVLSRRTLPGIGSDTRKTTRFDVRSTPYILLYLIDMRDCARTSICPDELKHANLTIATVLDPLKWHFGSDILYCCYCHTGVAFLVLSQGIALKIEKSLS